MRKFLLVLTGFLLIAAVGRSQTCTPAGDEVSFGTGGVWIGYAYDNMNFTSYRGYINAGAAGNPNFDMNFGGSSGLFTTNGCDVDRNTFSVRYKLRNTFANSAYRIIVGGDDGYRLSIDNGATWIISNWNDHAYTTTTVDLSLNGTYDMILEYYENGGDNRVSFNITATCTGTENTAIYGTNNVWNGYVYDATNFGHYIGMIPAGNAASPNFDHNFGGDNVTLNTSGCSTTTETFSVRYRLRRSFAAGTYQFTVGGDDGYRLSLDGGVTWVIDRWYDQSFTSTITSPISMSGSYDMVIEYYENGGHNRISFNMDVLTLLPITLIDFIAAAQGNQTQLNWITGGNSNPDYFVVERSMDNRNFAAIGEVAATPGVHQTQFYFTDATSQTGKVYYRLKMVDLDRRVTYSSSITVSRSSLSKTGLQIFPTVVSSAQIQIRVAHTVKSAELVIVDLSGQVVFRRTLSSLNADQTQTVSLAGWRAGKGIYLVNLVSAQEPTLTQKIIVP